MTEASGERLERTDAPALFFRSWTPSTKALAVLVIVPGFNSHSGYYASAAGEFAAVGIAVVAIDLRGRGRSDGDRFYVDSFAEYVADVVALLTLAKARFPGVPTFLLGHSAGGVVACLVALAHGEQLTGLISESFAFELPAPDFALAVIKGLSHIAPHAPVLKLKNSDFSRDPDVVAAMDTDPLIAGETQPSETLAALVRADEQLKSGIADIALPVLILHGTADHAAKPAGSQYIYDHVGSSDKTLRLYPGGFHDPLNDIEKDVVRRDIQEWVIARLSS